MLPANRVHVFVLSALRKIPFPVAATVVLMVAGAALRLVALEADPGYYLWFGYLTDEGRWNESARSLALFGELAKSDLAAMHLALSPVYQGVELVTFATLGVGLWSARLFSALAGTGLLVVPVLVLRRPLGWLGVLPLAAWLGFDVTLLTMGRVAVPEVPSLAMLMAAYLVTVLWRAPLAAPLLGGLAFAAACGLKGTVLLMLPGFLAVAALSGEAASLRHGARRAAVFLGAVLVPALTGAFLLFAVGFLTPVRFAWVGSSLVDFVAPGSLYGIVSRVFIDERAELINVLLVIGWYLLAARRSMGTGGSMAGRVFDTATAWAAWSFLLALMLDYWPARYLVQSTVPVALMIASGAAMGYLDEPRVSAHLAAPRRKLMEMARACYLAVPTGAIVGSLGASLALATGLMDLDRLLERMVLAAAGMAAVAIVAYRWRYRQGLVSALLFLPLLASLFWVAVEGAGWLQNFWGTIDPSAVAMWALGLAVLLIAAELARRRHLPALLVVVVILPISTLTRFPFDYTYTQRDVGRQVAADLTGETFALSDGATSLFLDNRVRYTESWREPGIEAVVTYHRECCVKELERLPGDYVEVAEHYVQLNLGRDRARITVHRRIDPVAKHGG